MGQALVAKIFSRQAEAATDGAGDGPQNPETTWWCRMLGRVVGTVGGLIALLCGLLTFINWTPLCIIAGLLLMGAAVVVLVFEAPICCTFIEATKPIAAFAEHRTYFQKAIIYVIFGIVPLALCQDLSAFFGCAPIFACGVIYGIMGLGRKADRDSMMTTAATDRSHDAVKPDDSRDGLIDNDNLRNPQSSFTPGTQGAY